MNWNISGWAIRQPVPTIVLFLILMVLGVMSFMNLPVTRFPNIDVPIIQVRVFQSGAAPVELESQVGKKLEDAVAGINGVRHITTGLTDGAAIMTIEFRLEINADRALIDVKDAVARVRGELPRNIEEPIVARLDIEGLPIVTYAARAPGLTPEQISWFVDDVVIRDLQGIRGVGKVERIGGVDREIRIELHPDRLASFGITAGEVNRVVRAINVDLAGGRGEIGGREQAIRTLAGKKSVSELAGTLVPISGGRKVRLDELGTVLDGYAEPRLFATFNSQPVVAFAITRATGASDTVVSAAVQKSVDELQRRYPNVELKMIDTTTTAVRGAYDSTMTTLIEGALLAIAVVFLFLRDWRATLITSLTLPLSIFPTYWLLDTIGFSLNLVSLLAITIAVGILVDDAIVEIENIVRHMREGKSPYRAALDAADEIGLAVMAITLTIIAVFTPVSFMGGIAGQYFKQFGLTVAISVFFSLLVARLVTPMLAAYFLRDAPHEEREPTWLRLYTKLIGWSVRHHFITVGLGLMIFAGSVGSFFLLPTAFIPPDDSGRALLAVELPPGTRLEDTRRITNEITERIRARPEVQSVFVNGGRILGSGSEVRKATFTINLADKKERKLNQTEVSEAIGRDLAKVPDIRYWFLRDNGQRAFALVVTGRDGEAVEKTAALLTGAARRVTGRDGAPLLTNVVSTAELDRPELRIKPRSDMAAELGVTSEAISETIRIATIGDVGAQLAKFTIDDRQVPIRVQLAGEARADELVLSGLKVPIGGGGSVPLSTVADLEMAQGPTSIERYDRQRRVVIGGDLVGATPLGAAVAAVTSLPAVKALPPGIEVKEFGDAEIMGEVFESFANAMLAGIIMMYAVLVLLFNAFLPPVVIMFALPLSIGGAIVALAMTGHAVSLPVVIGILMLMGIVTKNSILLVDFTLERMAHGMSRAEALIDAGRKRARPIIMTTIAMVGGMTPAALNAGHGGDFRVPMAIAVIGGLLSSTFLSLVLVPAVFAVVDDIGRLIWRIFGRFVGPSDEGPGKVGASTTATMERSQAKPTRPAELPPRPIAAE